jgi:thymidine kinase
MSVEVITGPMFSGKTTELFKRVTRWVDVTGSKALIINHIYDKKRHTSPTQKSSTHSSYKGLSEKIDIQMEDDLSSVDVTEYTIIGIDEANFFNDLFAYVNKWALQGKHIVVVGIDSDFKGARFGTISDLLPISDSFVKLTAICSRCLRETEERGEIITPCNITPAPFTEKIVKDDKITDVGGSDKYIAVCRKHHSYL